MRGRFELLDVDWLNEEPKPLPVPLEGYEVPWQNVIPHLEAGHRIRNDFGGVMPPVYWELRDGTLWRHGPVVGWVNTGSVHLVNLNWDRGSTYYVVSKDVPCGLVWGP